MIVLADKETRWVEKYDISSSKRWWKKLPYRECPNCGKYDYTTFRSPIWDEVPYEEEPTEDAGLLSRLLGHPTYPETTRKVVGYEKKEYCENCEYLENRREEAKEGFEDQFDGDPRSE